MHKRRVDMLDHVLNELNPQYYLAICKQLAFELGGYYQFTLLSKPIDGQHFKAIINLLTVFSSTTCACLTNKKIVHFHQGGVYQDMMDLKLSIFKPDQAKSMSQALKINKLYVSKP